MKSQEIKRFKIFLKNFNSLLNGTGPENLDKTGPAVKDIALGILKIFHPETVFEIIKKSEVNTLAEPKWSKDYIKNFWVVPKDTPELKQYKKKAADISLVYIYDNPRDGDGWTITVTFEDKTREHLYKFIISTQSNLTEPGINLYVYKLEEKHMSAIEDFLNSYFKDNAKFSLVKDS